MKGKGCADGRPQQEYVKNEESGSPTVLLYTFMVLCIMNTMGNRKILIVDISGAFIQGDWSQDKHHGYIVFERI